MDHEEKVVHLMLPYKISSFHYLYFNLIIQLITFHVGANYSDTFYIINTYIPPMPDDDEPPPYVDDPPP